MVFGGNGREEEESAVRNDWKGRRERNAGAAGAGKI